MTSLRFVPLALVAGAMLWSSTAMAQTSDDHQGSQKADSAILFDTLNVRKDSTLLAQLTAAIRTARRKGRTPIVDIGSPHCGPCHMIEHLLQEPAMRTEMQRMYVISLNLDVWHDALEKLGFDVNHGIPRVAVVDSTGHQVGEAWQIVDVPDSLVIHPGWRGVWGASLTALFAKAREQFPPLAPTPAGTADTVSKPKAS